MIFETTKQRAIFTTARQLFWKHGTKRVSIEEICKLAQVSKMTFYKYYSNKTELAKIILTDLLEQSIEDFKKIQNSDISFKEKLEKILLLKIEGTNNISVELINDIYNNTNTELTQIMSEYTDKFSKDIVLFFEKAKSDGFIRKNVNVNFLMTFSSQIINLMNNEQFISNYKNPQTFIIETIELLFYGILSDNA